MKVFPDGYSSLSSSIKADPDTQIIIYFNKS